MFTKILKYLPAACAFTILAWQMAIPWAVSHFITADGPSHLYGATVARDLVFHHKHSVYSAVYTIQRNVIPNWMTTVVLAVAGVLTGAEHAEKLFASLAILAGFLGLCYLNRALAPDRSPWTPLMNFAVQSWFLWVGFYNFYLGLVLLPFLIGFYIRSIGSFTLKRALLLAFGLSALFFTHLIAVAMGVAALISIAAWTGLFKTREPLFRRFAEVGFVLLSSIPAIVLVLIYIHGAPPSDKLFEFAADWRHFPHHTFWTGQGDAGHQIFLYRFVLCYIVAGIVLMTRKEWTSARGGLLLATLVAFAGYMLIPDSGFGGSVVKLRFAWAVFILGCPLAASVTRLQYVSAPVALCVAFFLSQNGVATAEEARRVSNSADSYLAATASVASGASFIRLHYPTPGAAALYGYDGNARFPFSHLDSLAAARNNDIDLTDYEAPSELFPVIFKKPGHEVRSQLWGFEGPGKGEEVTLKWIEDGFPIPVDFLLVVGDEHAPGSIQQGMPEMLTYLDFNMQLIATSSDRLMRVYRRRNFTQRKF